MTFENKAHSQWVSIVCSFLILFFLSQSVVAVADTVDDESENNCLPAILFLRGSGEGLDEEGNKDIDPKDYIPIGSNVASFSTNGHEGPVLERLLDKYVNETTITDVGSKVRFVGIDYPSEPVFPMLQFGEHQVITYFKHIITYYGSFAAGAKNILHFINNDKDAEGNACKTQYMLVGYSQGVISVRLAINLLGNKNNKVISTYVVGDPWQKAEATTFPDQSSVANTSTETNGIGRGAVSWAQELSAGLGIKSEPINALKTWGADIKKSDAVIYRKPGGTLPVGSRSLCHFKDPTCGLSFFETGLIPDMGEHTNYFDIDSPAGSIDLQHEAQGFDTQVKQLIASSYAYNQERELNQTPSIKSKETIYNINNLKEGDRCWWDENSDGTIEGSGYDCRGGYEMESLGGLTKMTVTVRDIDNIEYVYSTEDTAIEPEIVNDILSLKLGEWYQFHPYDNPTDCLGIRQPDNQDWTLQNGGAIQRTLLISDCSTATPEGFAEEAETGKQSFKIDLYNLEDPNEDPVVYKDYKQLANGYDQNEILSYGKGYPGVSESARMQQLQTWGSSSENGFMPQLTRIIDGVPYYSFKGSSGNCMASDYTQSSVLFEAGCSNTSQLFSVTHVDVDLGKLAVQYDVTPPEKVENLTVNNVTRTKATFNWEETIDNRGGQLAYSIYDKADMANPFMAAGISSDPGFKPSITIDLSETEVGSSRTYVVKAVDGTGNLSLDSNEVTIITPPVEIISKPATPTLESVSYNKDNVSIMLPYDNEGFEYIDIYRNGELIKTLTYSASMYTDETTEPNQTYSYGYKIRYNADKETEMSELLTVETGSLIDETLPPEAPVIIDVQQYPPDIVFVSWNYTADGMGNSLRYEVYRDGVLLSDSVYEDYYIDYSVPEGNHSYSIIAADSEGRKSVMSDAVSIEVVIEETPPVNTSRPINLYGYQSDNSSAELSWDYDTGNANTFYTVYRDGVMIIDELYDKSFKDIGLTEGYYSYTVTATDSEGQTTQHSDPTYVQITDGNNVPTPVGNVQGSQINPNSVQISWDYSSSPDVTYAVYRNGVMLQNGITDDFYIDTPVAAGNYIYYIKTVNTLGEETMYGDSVFVEVVTE